MASLNNVGGVNVFADGAIVGEAPKPFSAIFISPGSYLTSGSLAQGDPGELGGLDSATFEFWVAVPLVSLAANRTLVIGPETAAGLRQWGFEITPSHTIRFYVRNQATNAAFLVTSTSALGNDWNHIVGVADSAGALVRLYINGTQEASTAWSGQTIRASSLSATAGDMRVGDPAMESSQSVDEMAIYRKALAGSRISAHYVGGTSRGFPRRTGDANAQSVSGRTPGARMVDVLDQSASVHAGRSIQAGVNLVTDSYMTGQPPLHELQKATEADNVDAMLFVSKSGAITFLGAAHRSSAPYNTVQATFGDAGGSELPYLDIALDYSDAFLINRWDVTREQGRLDAGGSTGQTQTTSDGTSISRYFERPQSLTDLPVINDAAALQIATDLLAKTKDPMLRVTSLALSTTDPNVADAALALELGDRIRVLRTPPGGGARIDQTVFVQKIEVAGANDGQPWSIRLGVSPL